MGMQTILSPDYFLTNTLETTFILSADPKISASNCKSAASKGAASKGAAIWRKRLFFQLRPQGTNPNC